MARDFFSFYRSFDYLGLRIDKLKVESGIFIEKSHFRSSKKSDGNELHFRRKLGYGGHPTGLPNTSVPVCPSRKGRKKPKRKRKCEKLNFRSRFRRPVRTGLTPARGRIRLRTPGRSGPRTNLGVKLRTDGTCAPARGWLAWCEGFSSGC